MNTVTSMWKEFESSAIPVHAGLIQRSDCKIAFYAGAASLFACLMEAIEKKVPAIEGALALESIEKELLEFINHRPSN